MRAIVFENGLHIRDLPMPEPLEGEALISVSMAGICNTDLELRSGYMNFRGVPGHEFVGIVVRADNAHLVGKRVVGEINCVCHECRYCKNEMSRHCANRTVLGIVNRNGAFAQFITLPMENLHLVPDAMPDEVAVFTEPVAAAFRIIEQLAILPSDRVIVLGDGKLGQLIAQALWLRSKNVLCVGKHPWKLAILGVFGIPTALADAPLPGGADIVVEATGSAGGLTRALELVRPEGTVVLKTTVGHESCLDMSLPVVNEVRILGSRCGPFRPALEALALGNVEVRPMISQIYAFKDAATAFARATSPDAMKILVQMNPY